MKTCYTTIELFKVTVRKPPSSDTGFTILLDTVLQSHTKGSRKRVKMLQQQLLSVRDITHVATFKRAIVWLQGKPWISVSDRLHECLIVLRI